MARLFPPDPAGTAPAARLAAFLAGALGGAEDPWIWIRPSLPAPGRRIRPDLVILGESMGLLVLSVSPWNRAEIAAARGRILLVRGEGPEPTPRAHPEAGARDAAEFLGARLRGLRGAQMRRGEALAEAAWGVAHLHLSREDLRRLGETGVFDPERGIAREELARGSVGASLARLAGARKTRSIPAAVREQVRALIEPQLHFLDLREPAAVEVPPATVEPAPTPAVEPAIAVEPAPAPPPVLPGFWLDRKQERMARELASPRTLVYGPAGSGKTVFLVARAQYWLDRNPRARVLLTCYNASLASHLRRVFALRGQEPDDGRLTVRHYHDLCGRFLGLPDIHEQPPEFYAALEPRVLRDLASREDVPVYDCILVDEGQDFTRRMIEVLVQWNASGGEITVVCDPAQDIYGRWRPDNVGPLREPAVEHLVDCYRNTAPIFALALEVLPPETRRVMGLTRLEMTRPEDLGREGPVPQLLRLEGLDDLVSLVAGIARDFAGSGRPLSELAVLYSDRRAVPDFPALLARSHWGAARDPRFLSAEVAEDGEDAPAGHDVVQGTLHPMSDRDDLPPSERAHFAEALEAELGARGVPAQWVSRDFAAKAGYDITRPRVTVSTVHSAKGMDYHTVVLLGAESLTVKPGRDRERAEALLFTGITRARERLVIPYFQGTGWVPELAARLG